VPKRIDVQRHEWSALVVSFLYFFCVLAAYYIIRPVRDQLSAAVGSTSLPIFYAATFAATLAMTPLFGALVARYPRRRFVPAVYVFFIACLIGFIPLFQAQDAIGARLLGSVFFVWVSVFNLFVVAVFWSFMADIFDAEQAHRLFPVIALGGAAGAITGPALTRGVVHLIDVPGLLMLSAALLGFALLCIAHLLAWSQRHPVAGDARRDQRVIGGSFLAGAVQTLRSPLLRRIALLMLLGDCVGTVIYALQADYSQVTYPTREARIAFSSGVDFASNGLQVVLQMLLTRELMIRRGPPLALALDGLIKAVMLAGLAVFGGGWIVAAAIVTRASAYGVFKPAADSLYTQVDAETRYKAKNFIDTTVWRFGDLAITSTLNVLRTFGVSLVGFASLTAIAAAAASWVGWRITRTPGLHEPRRDPR